MRHQRPIHVPSRALLRAGVAALLGSIAIVLFLVVTRDPRARAEAGASHASSRVSTTAAAAKAPPSPSSPSVAEPARVATAAADAGPPASVAEPARVATAAVDAGPPAAATRARVRHAEGEIVPPRSAAGHRVFVDGTPVGEGTRPIRVDCGDHELRVGSAGRERRVTVPCGGTIDLR